MKEYQLRQGLGKTIAFSLCVWASVAGFFSCDSDRLNSGGSTGMLSLNLAADTTNIKGGAISTKAGNTLADFEDVDEYTVQVLQESDTLKSALYKDFPEQLEIKEGSYTLRASKGGNLPAAFDNPYFEGSTDFVIKKDMKTPLEVTCTMANARIYTEYTEDFLKAYSDYSVSLKTSYMDGAFTIAKDETRGAYLQVAKEGTPLSIAISLMRENWEEPKVYSVTNPSITLNPKESVTLKFATDGKTGDGLNLSVVLDDEMIETDLVDSIPDFMWKPFEDLKIEAIGFVNNEVVPMTVTEGYPNSTCMVRASVPGRIKECWVVRLEDGEKTDSVDIATSAGLNTAEEVWGLKSVSSPIAGAKGIELDLKSAFNQLYASANDKTYGFSVYVNDALNVMHTSDVVTASVNLKAAKEPTVGIFEWSVSSKHSLEKDTAIAVMAEVGIKTLTLKVNKDGAMQGQYDMLSDNLPDGIFYDKQSRKIIFKKECSSKFDSKEQDASTYSYEVSVTDNLDKKVTVTSTLEVTPVFTIIVPEGGVWAKKATIQVVEDVKYSKSYQLKVGEKWQDYSDATITGLQPNTTYTVRALVNNWPTTEATFTTEEAFQIPDGGFDKEWTKDVISAVNYSIPIINIGLVGQNIDIWYPFNKENKQDLFWSTTNPTTTSADTKHGTAYYIQYSGVQRKNKAVEISTIGWGYGSTFTQKLGCNPKIVTPGAMFASSFVNGKIIEGHPISSRPSMLSFNYEYQPLDGDKFIVSISLFDVAGSLIAKKEEQIGNTSGTCNLVLNYSSPNDRKAAQIKIKFESGTKLSYKGVRGSVGDLQGNSDSRIIGSVLTIDNVELIYE